VLIKDEVRGRTVPVAATGARWNLRNSWREASGLTAIPNNTGIANIFNSVKVNGLAQDPEMLALGDFVMASYQADTQGLLMSQGYVQTAESGLTKGNYGVHVQNMSGSTITLTNPSVWFFKMPRSMVKWQVSAAYDMPSTANGLQVTTTLPIPGAVMGDFLISSLADNIGGVLFRAYMSADGTATYLILNESGFTKDPASATLRIAVVREEAFRLLGAVTYNPPSLADGASSSVTITVPGAVLGDFVLHSFSNDMQGIFSTAWVSAANIVTVQFDNETGGVIDLASGILRVGVLDTDNLPGVS
jgi:hypothetical protein